MRDCIHSSSPPPPPWMEMEMDRTISYYRSLLRSCSVGQSPPIHGEIVHNFLLKSGLLLLTPISTALFHMYAAVSSSSAAAVRSFRDISLPSSVDFTALISSLSRRHSLPSAALRLFRSMRRAAVPPDAVALLALLSAAARLADPAAGAGAHVLFLKLGFPFSTPARNAAADVYAKCGMMSEARRLFDEVPEPPTVVSWTVLLTGALRWEGLDSGRQMFERMPQKNEVSWTVMIAACVEAGLVREAFSLLSRMLFGCDPVRNLNFISSCSLLSSCSQAGDLTLGRWIHTHITKTGLLDDDQRVVVVGTALIDMYGKCGRIDAARRLFETLQQRNLVTWNAMLNSLSMHGMGSEVLHFFSRMVEEGGQQPDDITFVSVLSACSRSGLVEQGKKLFQDLGLVYGLTPGVEHYACMVDLLGRAGQLKEAEALIREMPVCPNEVVLGSLLASCGLHRKLEMGRKFMQELLQMDPHNTEYHVLLSNMYITSGRHAEADNLRQVMKSRGIRKVPGVSFIEINGYVHHFTAGDKSHPLTLEIYAMMDEVIQRLRLAGYTADAASQISHVPDSCLANEEEREDREQALLVHSEKLAICFGLLSTKPGVPLRIFKNLRICSDCHSAIKLISAIFEREIIVRDRNRFHLFKEGVCSCSDYW
ncbi:pentatricopeptide repeat-containing protein At5g15340, mitochondrial [Typha angustifolia]|uniref:pentatricopeptide repeat-containing protein At5g15340, mitochondrial n=1 Tax=Typha angustifolia TaxID=59011 RepID=UPI003C2BC10E